MMGETPCGVLLIGDINGEWEVLDELDEFEIDIDADVSESWAGGWLDIDMELGGSLKLLWRISISGILVESMVLLRAAFIT